MDINKIQQKLKADWGATLQATQGQAQFASLDPSKPFKPNPVQVKWLADKNDEIVRALASAEKELSDAQSRCLQKAIDDSYQWLMVDFARRVMRGETTDIEHQQLTQILMGLEKDTVPGAAAVREQLEQWRALA